MLHRDGLTIEAVSEECNKQGVTQILPLFCDVNGMVKCQQIPIAQLPKAYTRGVLVDGSSVAGFARIEESDLRAKLDLSTFRILPWAIGGQETAIVLCDVITPEGQAFEGDPRHILRRIISQPSVNARLINAGPEAEFYIFRQSDSPVILDRGGYFDLVPDSVGLDLRSRIIEALTALEIEVEVGHHEVAPSQHEIDLKYLPALEMADTLMVYRFVVKRVAESHGYYATFMPKPIEDVNGSGMHVHFSIFESGRNLFFDAQDKNGYHLSDLARSFLAGLLQFAPEIALVTNPWVNSYKRLVPGFEAPVYICWGRANRSALVRVPGYEPGHEEAVRLEVRYPDPSGNPYLVFACLIAAGLTGGKKDLSPPKPVERDVYHLTEAERSQLNIGSLPADLAEALKVFRQSELALETLGPHTFGKVVANAEVQLSRWQRAVTDFELREYLSVL